MNNTHAFFTGTTVMSHDSEALTNVGNCNDTGCYKKDVTYYNTTMKQLAALAEVSKSCQQSIKVI